MTLTAQDRKILEAALADSPQFQSFRERQVFVRHAIAGYPESHEIEKNLRSIDLEGSPAVVAFELVRRLEGYQLDSNLPVLAVVAQSLEPMSSWDHKRAIADLRKRMGWTQITEPTATTEDWQDTRPAMEVVQERILGENTLRPLYYLRRGLHAADAVVCISLNGSRIGTGFLVAPNLVMTNHHVIADARQAADSCAVLFFETQDPDADPNSETPLPPPLVIEPVKDALVYTNPVLDFTLVRLRKHPKVPAHLRLRPARVAPNDRVVIIQHPDGHPKQISLQNNLVAAADDKVVQYYTSTKGGSSGSPVLDDNFDVVAIHHGWVHNPAWEKKSKELRLPDPKQIEDRQYRNQGTSMIAVLQDLEANAPDVLKELTICAK